MSSSGAGNDHRLGANEAPPAIISIYLGSYIEDVLYGLYKPGKTAAEDADAKKEFSPVSGLSYIPRDNTDRNRTSPVAFTGNKFEFRMPFAIDCAHMLAKKLEEVRRQDKRLRPDGKTQVTAQYDDGVVTRVDTIVVSTQHTKDITQKQLRKLIIDKVIKPVIDPKLLDKKTKILVNPSGSFILGGSWGDSGTTGRKIVVDSYGGYAPIGGGCFSSKDPTKVDRSAAYYARYVCKNLVANKLCRKCQLQLSYAIGEPRPLSINIQTFGTSMMSFSLRNLPFGDFGFV